jgi:hypothetical protein
MGILLQPWSLLLFGVIMFFAFLAMGARGDSRSVTPLTRWIIVGKCVAIEIFGVIRVLRFNRTATGPHSSLEQKSQPSLRVGLRAIGRQSETHLEI